MDNEQISVRELRDRLSAIIEDNERRGWPERNDKPVVVEMQRAGKNTKCWYMPLNRYVLGVLYGVGGKDFGTILQINEEQAYRPAARQKKSPWWQDTSA